MPETATPGIDVRPLVDGGGGGGELFDVADARTKTL